MPARRTPHLREGIWGGAHAGALFEKVKLFVICEMVGVGGFEPPTSRSRTVRSSLTELHPDGYSILLDAAGSVAS